MAYLVLADALARAKERSGAGAADDAFLTELLTLSAGTDAASQVHYRPFFCAARWLEQNRPQQTLSEAKGVKFTGLSTPIASLLALQTAYDRANALILPEGMEALTTTSTNLYRYPTRSSTTNTRP